MKIYALGIDLGKTVYLKSLFREMSSCQVCWRKIEMAMGLSHAFETRYRQRSLQAVQFMRTKASG
jgi:hypothetical protein